MDTSTERTFRLMGLLKGILKSTLYDKLDPNKPDNNQKYSEQISWEKQQVQHIFSPFMTDAHFKELFILACEP